MKFKIGELLVYLNDPDVVIEVIEYTNETTCFRGKLVKDERGGGEVGSIFLFNENEFDLTQKSRYERYFKELVRVDTE